MMIPSFETARLSVMHWADMSWNSDKRNGVETALSGMLTEPVLRDLPPSLHLADQPVRDWIAERTRESDLYLISRKEDQTPIGLLVLAVFERAQSVKTIHLGYLFGQMHWGRGYATELVKGLVATAEPLAPIALRGGVAVANPNSASVLKKAGFVMQSTQPDPDMQQFGLDLT